MASADALNLIDTFLIDTAHQSLIDGDRVRDLLLDVRSQLAAPDLLEELMRDA